MSMTSRAQYRELFSCIRGATAVEFAIILPLFLLILFGIISLGFAFFIWNDMTNAAREGARRLSVDDAITEAQAEAIVHDWLAPWPATFEVTACKVAAQVIPRMTPRHPFKGLNNNLIALFNVRFAL